LDSVNFTASISDVAAELSLSRPYVWRTVKELELGREERGQIRLSPEDVEILTAHLEARRRK